MQNVFYPSHSTQHIVCVILHIEIHHRKNLRRPNFLQWLSRNEFDKHRKYRPAEFVQFAIAVALAIFLLHFSNICSLCERIRLDMHANFVNEYGTRQYSGNTHKYDVHRNHLL